MKESTEKGKGRYHLAMILLITLWGLEVSLARDALDVVDSVTLMNFRYLMGLVVLGVILKIRGTFRLPRKRDWIFLIASTLAGHIIYYLFEYTAIVMIPVANFTVVIAVVPIGTILIEKLAFKRRISLLMIVCMFICIAGIMMTISDDLFPLTGGHLAGYLLCLGAVAAWIAYMFLTEAIDEKFDSVCVAFYQVVIATVLTAPYAVSHLPSTDVLSTKVVAEILFLGFIGEGVGFLIEVTGIQKLGPTISAVYSNFMPVTTAIFGVILLAQNLTILQIAGGIIVIVSGYIVIREKSKLNQA